MTNIVISVIVLSLSLLCVDSKQHFNRKNESKNKKKNVLPSLSSFSSLINEDQRNDTITPSLLQLDVIEKDSTFTLTSMVIDHGRGGSWFVPSLHEKYSAGWNRTVNRQYISHPHSCNIRFFGIALEKTLEGYVRGGTGYLTMDTMTKNKNQNEDEKIHCYYMTNKDYGSEFLTTPKTLAIVVTCTVYLDDEIGKYDFKKQMNDGKICRILSDASTSVTVNLRPTSFKVNFTAVR